MNPTAGDIVITPDWPAPSRVRAASTTRVGGRSAGAYATFNLATHVGDNPQAVAANRQHLREILDLPAAPVWLAQIHGARVVAADPQAPVPEADGAFARRAGVVCAVLTADCLPVLLCDRRATRVAALHAGWRGLLAGVLEAAVGALDLPGHELIAWLGPGIGFDAYAVDAALRARFLGSRPAFATAFGRAGEHWHADLQALARLALRHAGVTEVYAHPGCTFRDAGRFFSFRREGRTGRMATVIWLDDG